jgi:hypothetical protein
MTVATWKEDRALVDELCAIDEGLSEWEMNFADSISKQVIDGMQVLSDKQRAVAERILTQKG